MAVYICILLCKTATTKVTATILLMHTVTNQRVIGHNCIVAEWFDHAWLQTFVMELAPAYSENLLPQGYDALKEKWLFLYSDNNRPAYCTTPSFPLD